MKAIEKLAAEHDALLANYDALLGLLSRVASGEIGRGRLAVDLQARTWRLEPEPAPRFVLDEPPAVSLDDLREAEGAADVNGTHAE